MTLFIISFLAGALTVLAPCILPLLPVVIGTSAGSRSRLTPYVVIGALSLSVLLFTYLLKATTALIAIPSYVWGFISGGILLLIGLVFIFPGLWARAPLVGRWSGRANQLVGEGYQKKSLWGDAVIGAALGPVFSTCSPTYFVILATVLPASFLLGTVYLLAYIAGLALVLLLIALLGQRFTQRLNVLADDRGWFKRGLGVIFAVLGVIIIMGWDKDIEARLLDAGYWGLSGLESAWLEQVEVVDDEDTLPSARERAQEIPNARSSTLPEREFAVDVPGHLVRAFPETDWSQADPAIEGALSGGPGKDGIPSIDDPSFVPLQEFSRPDSVQAVVLERGNEVRVYPYNILTWHEIVNDTIAGEPVAVTFCPLCGSAITFDRTLPEGTVTTFGVSGSLLESNLLMYDRATESLWQQSTGKALAGEHFGSRLTIVPMQLLTLGEVRERFPDAQVLSEDTGYRRDYGRNPYAGYDDRDGTIFPSRGTDDTRFDQKEIMVVFRATAETPVAVPWQALRAAGGTTATIDGATFDLTLDGSELTITNDTGETLPFYFEMWFSFAAQHGEDAEVISLP